jgi:hypothetical protein
MPVHLHLQCKGCGLIIKGPNLMGEEVGKVVAYLTSTECPRCGGNPFQMTVTDQPAGDPAEPRAPRPAERNGDELIDVPIETTHTVD